jgi:hypothetical protein
VNKENPMTPVYIDAKGREHELIIAEKSMTVPDPKFGFNRKIVAGQPVPPELESAYEGGGTGKPARASSEPKSETETPAKEPARAPARRKPASTHK